MNNLVVSTRCDHTTTRCIVCAPVLNGKSGAEQRRLLEVALAAMRGAEDAPYAFWLGAEG